MSQDDQARMEELEFRLNSLMNQYKVMGDEICDMQHEIRSIRRGSEGEWILDYDAD